MSWIHWIGARPERLICAGRKRELPRLQPGQTAIRIAFRGEVVWCVLDGNALVANDGSKFPFAEVNIDGIRYCGLLLDDYSSLDYCPAACAFRDAMQARQREGATP